MNLEMANIACTGGWVTGTTKEVKILVTSAVSKKVL
jgi:hypothetical protein